MILDVFSSFDWLVGALGYLFIGLLDTIVYLLMSSTYDLFTNIASLNIFSTQGAVDLYDGFTSRVYTVLTIIMIFFFTYQLLLMIIEPEGDLAKKTSDIIKRVITSLIMLAVAPTFYNYMGIFQTHIVQENIILNMVLGNSGGGNIESDDYGKYVAMITYMSLYHPNNTTYSTFITSSGNLSDTATEDCTSLVSEEDSTYASEICASWNNAMQSWQMYKKHTIAELTLKGDWILKSHIGDGVEYMWVLATILGLAIDWMLLSYSIDLGTRAVKLAFLEIISPVPIVFRIFPQTKPNYDKWFKETKKTYLDVFIRLLTLAFTIQMIIMVPLFVTSVFASDNSSGFLKAMSSIVIVLGLLAFAKDAPKLVKDLFNVDGMLDGINLKPGVTSRLKENPGVNAVRGAVYGATSGKGGSRVSGAISGMFAGGLGKDGYAGAVKKIDQYRTEKANGSTIHGRMIDRGRMAIGMETRGAALDRKLKRDEYNFEGVDANGNAIKISSKAQFDKIRQDAVDNQTKAKENQTKASNLQSGYEGVRDAIKNAIESDSSQFEFQYTDSSGNLIKGTYAQHIAYRDAMRKQMEEQLQKDVEEQQANGVSMEDINDYYTQQYEKINQTISAIDQARSTAEKNLKTKLGDALLNNKTQCEGFEIKAATIESFNKSLNTITDNGGTLENADTKTISDAIDAATKSSYAASREASRTTDIVTKIDDAKRTQDKTIREKRNEEKSQQEFADDRSVHGSGQQEKK